MHQNPTWNSETETNLGSNPAKELMPVCRESLNFCREREENHLLKLMKTTGTSRVRKAKAGLHSPYLTNEAGLQFLSPDDIMTGTDLCITKMCSVSSQNNLESTLNFAPDDWKKIEMYGKCMGLAVPQTWRLVLRHALSLWYGEHLLGADIEWEGRRCWMGSNESTSPLQNLRPALL